MKSYNILMICYYYPPLLDVGCKRSVAFSKYFNRYGWNPVVLSVKNPDKTYCILGNDRPPAGVRTEYSYSIINLYKIFGMLHAALSKVLKLVGVKLKRNYFYDIFCIPDIFWGWIPLTIFKGLWIIHKYDINAVYVSCPPFSSAIIGIALTKLTKRPLVIDFRDPFAVDSQKFSNIPALRRRLHRHFEKWFIRELDTLLVVTDELRSIYLKQYPELKNRVFTLHNGVDPELFQLKTPLAKYDKFTIIYAGLYFYASYEWDPEFFFEALAILKEQGNIDKRNFQFLFYGDGAERITEIAIAYGVENLVVATHRIHYKDMLCAISRSHLQLLRNREFGVPSKLYDGVYLNVPFLATIPDGEAAVIIRTYSPSSYVIIKESAHDVAMAIIDAIDKYRKNDILDNNINEFLKRFLRESLTIKLMNVFKDKIME